MKRSPLKTKTPPKKSPKAAKNKATVLHSKIVRAYGKCESCGSRDQLQCAHIVSRRYAHTRTDETNAFCLCAGCHIRYTEWPLEFAEFVRDRIGQDAYDELRFKALDTSKMDWDAELDRLRIVASSLGLT